ncbi:hypothetical protein GCM10027416_16840 [Okibacterium endophyticum]
MTGTRGRPGRLIAATIIVALLGLAAPMAAHADDEGELDTPIGIVIPEPSTPPSEPPPTSPPANDPPVGAPTDVPPIEEPPQSRPLPPPSDGGNGAGTDATPESAPDGEPVAPTPGDAPVDGADSARIDDPRPHRDDEVTVTGTGFQPGEQVQLVLYSEPVVVASYPAGDDGVVVAPFRVPKDMETGVHTAELTGWASEKVQNVEFTVVSDAGAWVSADSSLWMWWGGGLGLAALMGALLWFLWLRGRERAPVRRLAGA